MDEAERVFREDADRWRQRYEELRQKCGSVDLSEHQRVTAALEVCAPPPPTSLFATYSCFKIAALELPNDLCYAPMMCT